MNIEVDKFIELVDQILDDLKNPGHKKAFADNMKHLKMNEQSFCSWLMTYLSWSEIGTEKDCDFFYGHYGNPEQ